MRSKHYIFKLSEVPEPIVETLSLDDGETVYDLTDKDIEYRIRKLGSAGALENMLVESGSIVDATGGIAKYDPADGWLTEVGYYYADFRVSDADRDVSFPPEGYYNIIEIVP